MANATISEPATQHALRQLQDRQQRLLELSSDWYWEQDDLYRFTTILAPTATATADAQNYIGKTFWNINALSVINADNWDSLRARMHAREPFANFLTNYMATPTDRRCVGISGQPLFSSGGQFIGYYGLAKDVTAAFREQQLLKLQHSITARLSEASDIAQELQTVLQSIGSSEHWDCAACWSIDGDFMLPQYLSWQAATANAAAIGHLGELLAKNANDGWIDQRLHLNAALWIADMAILPGCKSAAAGEHSLRTLFAFPIGAAGKVIGIVAFARAKVRKQDALLLQTGAVLGQQIGNFSQRQRSEYTLRASEARFRSLTEFSSDWYWEQDQQFCFVDVAGKDLNTNRNFVGKTHWDPSFHTEPVGMSWDEHKARVMAHQPFRDLILKGSTRDGSAIYYSLSGHPFFDDGEFKGYRGVGRDITEQRRSEERIRYLASHDPLTALPNRSMFSELLCMTINYSHRYKHSFAVMFIDLDRFKLINDTLGHDAGDTLLKEVASRLKTVLRASDVVARLGGDEFVVLVQEVDAPDQAAIVARKILSATIKPLHILGQECRVTASVGISLYPADAQDEQSLMKNADIAMYQAKEAGKNNYQFYSSAAREQSLERLALEASLRRALEHNEFELHYQAKLDLRSDRITGVEALLRWQHPDLGSVAPAQFIPLAEETGLIVPIGRWVIRTACAQNMAWQRQGLPAVCIAVNLSARQFSDENLLNDISAALQESGLSGDLLEIELTESMVMQDYERTIKILRAIKAMNVRVAIDDFGVGYSSLAQIKNFPIDTLKVDRSFIRELPLNSEDSAITKAIIAMGKTLSLRVVAEGVETVEQEEFLRANACDETQGFYFSRPITPDKFADLLREHIAAPKI